MILGISCGRNVALDGQGKVTQRELWGPAVDQLLAYERVYPSTGNSLGMYWTLADHQGSVRDVVNNTAGWPGLLASWGREKPGLRNYSICVG